MEKEQREEKDLDLVAQQFLKGSPFQLFYIQANLIHNAFHSSLKSQKGTSAHKAKTMQLLSLIEDDN